MKVIPNSRSKDVLNAEQRSFCMSQNKSSGTKPEVLLIAECQALGLSPVVGTDIPGKPDFVFIDEKVSVFVDGCFWHGCPIHYSDPANKRDFWLHKLFANQLRDLYVSDTLRSEKWIVLRIWEHDLKNPLGLAAAARLIYESVHTEQPLKSTALKRQYSPPATHSSQ